LDSFVGVVDGTIAGQIMKKSTGNVPAYLLLYASGKENFYKAVCRQGHPDGPCSLPGWLSLLLKG
jgi:hypothetical protein